ncbi:flagellin [Imhoffiella purpurea]|uniref:Flagellin n=1 Tax=Imhoffiella purpurea TaxID=1249627 RepID=W9VFB2_9GAMM|nr:flagellin [Imhoffiella purpurea]EXJ14737.1 Flagellin protein FlaA [Imhoffiella purpurea]
MVGIGNNLSLTAQNSLNGNQKALETSQERMASGKQVNQASDDAAASALISQFASQIAGSQQASRNLGDSASLVGTAEAGVTQVGDAMERIRELSLQSLNGTLNDSDRESLQAEVGQLQDQIAQTLENTSFNGIQLLNREGSLSVQAGSDAEDAFSVGTYDIQGRLSELGFGEIDISSAAGAASAVGVLDQAGDLLDEVRGEMGAVMNRFDSALSNLQDSNIESVAARSRIEDADYAREAASQASGQIQQQANIAMMGQASRVSSQFVSQLLGLG